MSHHPHQDFSLELTLRPIRSLQFILILLGVEIKVEVVVENTHLVFHLCIQMIQ
jgi:hypothetical protein